MSIANLISLARLACGAHRHLVHPQRCAGGGVLAVRRRGLVGCGRRLHRQAFQSALRARRAARSDRRQGAARQPVRHLGARQPAAELAGDPGGVPRLADHRRLSPHRRGDAADALRAAVDQQDQHRACRSCSSPWCWPASASASTITGVERVLVYAVGATTILSGAGYIVRWVRSLAGAELGS